MTHVAATGEERLESRERLVETAIGLLHNSGYHAVGVQLLCERAGIRKGSFYHFFPSKEELTLAALDQAWGIFRERVIDPTLATESDPAARAELIRTACLAPIITNHRNTPGPHGCLFGRLAASITETEPLLKARLGEIFNEWAGLLGDGPAGWSLLADIQGRLVLAFAVDDPGVLTP